MLCSSQVGKAGGVVVLYKRTRVSVKRTRNCLLWMVDILATDCYTVGASELTHVYNRTRSNGMGTQTHCVSRGC